jgi:multisubunit Na+/H+ antiporter MnhC subunit
MAIIGLNISNKAVEAIMHMGKSQEKTAPGYGHKKRSTAVLQPLLTLNLIL